MTFTEELKYVRSAAVPCPDCPGGVCQGHLLKISWDDADPKGYNTVWIDGTPVWSIDDNELSAIVHLKWNFPQNGPGS